MKSQTPIYKSWNCDLCLTQFATKGSLSTHIKLKGTCGLVQGENMCCIRCKQQNITNDHACQFTTCKGCSKAVLVGKNHQENCIQMKNKKLLCKYCNQKWPYSSHARAHEEQCPQKDNPQINSEFRIYFNADIQTINPEQCANIEIIKDVNIITTQTAQPNIMTTYKEEQPKQKEITEEITTYAINPQPNSETKDVMTEKTKNLSSQPDELANIIDATINEEETNNELQTLLEQTPTTTNGMNFVDLYDNSWMDTDLLHSTEINSQNETQNNTTIETHLPSTTNQNSEESMEIKQHVITPTDQPDNKLPKPIEDNDGKTNKENQPHYNLDVTTAPKQTSSNVQTNKPSNSWRNSKLKLKERIKDKNEISKLTHDQIYVLYMR